MKYEGTLYRPPSEANSLIIQVTIGCLHNGCTFCSMYKDKKFRIRSLQDIFKDIEQSKFYYEGVQKIFLADGDALCLKAEYLKKILDKLNSVYPYYKRIGIYGTAKDVILKSTEELIELRKLGLGIVYMGLESGNKEILEDINKGVTIEEYIRACKKLKQSGIKSSVTVISGLGGKEKSIQHAKDTGKVLSLMDPEYVGLLTLILDDSTKMAQNVSRGEITLLTPKEVMKETKIMLENLKVTNCVFRSNHASNYISLKGTLPKDKDMLICLIDEVLKQNYNYKEDMYRLL